MLHGKSLVIVVAYDLYLKVAEGQLNVRREESKILMSFREMSSLQMLEYNLVLVASTLVILRCKLKHSKAVISDEWHSI
jgi:hypothetical protein